ncbi:MAG TPA: DNA (cytosine-5-)-methyltransferase [Verrucomicrobiae bacterium]|jgi:DNA (cytosine-5)-methyltransferase 1
MTKLSYRKKGRIKFAKKLRENASVYICPIRPALPLKVAEMFAGVGGFRVGLEKANQDAKRNLFDVIWANQFEPATKRQHAFEVYEACSKWQNNGIHSNQDISLVDTDSVPTIQLLVGGFPCQDYSVATTLKQAAGLIGKKGVLWWQIHRFLRDKHPPFGLFENVDRLLKSPATQRGKDFAVMLASLADLGYVAEWRVINAADYGMPQRRRRVFIMAYRKDTALAEKLLANRADWLMKSGTIAKAFPIEKLLLIPELSFSIKGSLSDITDKFNTKNPSVSPFLNAGLICEREVLTVKTIPSYDGQRKNLSDILVSDKQVDPSFVIPENEVKKWRYLKGAKSILRTKKNGVTYSYDEGPIPFPDPLDRPARTIITGEGGSTPSRFKHVVQMSNGKYRRLMPIELERINTFPDNHTKLDNMTDVKRAFFMGNALVAEIVTRLGASLTKAIETY